MRKTLAAAALSLAACAGPKPCTRALCPVSPGASYRVSGWSAPVTVEPGTPPLPIVSDASVQVLSGPAEFVNGHARVRAETGASFRFFVSQDPAHAPAVVLSSGAMTVTDAGTTRLTPGATYFLIAAP